MKKVRSLRIILGVLSGLFLIDLAWFFGTRSYLQSERFLKLVNTPELQFDAVDGYSPWPGYFIFHNFVFTGFSEKATYQVKAESIAFHLNPFALFQNKVAIRALTIQDVSIVVGDGPKDKAVIEEKKAQVKEMEAEAKERNGGETPYWTISFAHAVMHDVKEFRVRDWSFTGHADIKASFWLDTQGFFALDDSRVKMKDVKVLRAEEQLGTLNRATLTSDIQKFRLEDEPLESILPKIQTHWVLKGQLDRMDTIGSYLKDLSWLKLTGSALTMEGDIAMKDAHWQDESHLELKADSLHIKLLGQTIDGPGNFRWLVKKDGPNHLELSFGQYQLNQGRDGEGEGFQLTLDTEDKRVDQKFASWTSDITLPPTRIHRLQFLQAYVPPSLPLELEKGKGSIEGKFRAASDGKDTGGDLAIDVRDMSLRYKKDLSFRGDAKSKTHLTRLDLQKGEMDIADTGIDISKLDFLDKKDWKGSVHLKEARLRIEKPEFLKSHVHVEGDNLQPVLAFLVKDKSFPAWVMQAFDLKNPQVDLQVEATESQMKIRDFKAKAGELAMDGWFDGDKKSSRGKFLLEYSGFAGAYGWEGEDSEWKLSGAKEWFRKNLNVGR